MALISIVAGAYDGFLSPHGGNDVLPIGLTRNGYALKWMIHGVRSNKTTSFGSTLLDGVYLGADWSVQFVGREYTKRGLMEAMWPYSTLGDIPIDQKIGVSLSKVGKKHTSSAGTLLLIAVSLAGPVKTTAAGDFGVAGTGRPGTLTAKSAIIADGFPIELSFNSMERTVAISMNLLPYHESANNPEIIWFSTT